MRKPTPKEKAKELFFEMLNAGKGITSDYLARECAMICVNTILETVGTTESIKYWKEVKKELQSL